MAANKLTIKQVTAGFGISGVCLNAWRAGTATKAALPFDKDEETGAVSFKESTTLAWAKKHDLPFDMKAALKAASTGAATKAAPVKKSAMRIKQKPVSKKAASKPARKPTPRVVNGSGAEMSAAAAP